MKINKELDIKALITNTTFEQVHDDRKLLSSIDCYIRNCHLKVDAGTMMSLASGDIQVHISKQQLRQSL